MRSAPSTPVIETIAFDFAIEPPRLFIGVRGVQDDYEFQMAPSPCPRGTTYGKFGADGPWCGLRPRQRGRKLTVRALALLLYLALDRREASLSAPRPAEPRYLSPIEIDRALRGPVFRGETQNLVGSFLMTQVDRAAPRERSLFWFRPEWTRPERGRPVCLNWAANVVLDAEAARGWLAERGATLGVPRSVAAPSSAA